jgi:hypothetical protein
MTKGMAEMDTMQSRFDAAGLDGSHGGGGGGAMGVGGGRSSRRF